jgi:hypothetical protein
VTAPYQNSTGRRRTASTSTAAYVGPSNWGNFTRARVHAHPELQARRSHGRRQQFAGNAWADVPVELRRTPEDKANLA